MTNPWAPPGGAPSYAAGPPVPEHSTNAWAVVALLSGILALVPVAVVAGIVAHLQIRRGRQGGSAAALWGIALGNAWVLVAAGVAIAIQLLGGAYSHAGRTADAGSTSVGSCLQPPAEHDSLARAADCSGPHWGEVYHVERLTDGPWLGSLLINSAADDACYSRFDDYVGGSYEDSAYEYDWFAPDKAEWRAGEHRVICVVVPLDQDYLTGSVKGSER